MHPVLGAGRGCDERVRLGRDASTRNTGPASCDTTGPYVGPPAAPVLSSLHPDEAPAAASTKRSLDDHRTSPYFRFLSKLLHCCGSCGSGPIRPPEAECGTAFADVLFLRCAGLSGARESLRPHKAVHVQIISEASCIASLRVWYALSGMRRGGDAPLGTARFGWRQSTSRLVSLQTLSVGRRAGSPHPQRNRLRRRHPGRGMGPGG
jgi:hypothetical protein